MVSLKGSAYFLDVKFVIFVGIINKTFIQTQICIIKFVPAKCKHVANILLHITHFVGV